MVIIKKLYNVWISLPGTFQIISCQMAFTDFFKDRGYQHAALPVVEADFQSIIIIIINYYLPYDIYLFVFHVWNVFQLFADIFGGFHIVSL